MICCLWGDLSVLAGLALSSCLFPILLGLAPTLGCGTFEGDFFGVLALYGEDFTEDDDGVEVLEEDRDVEALVGEAGFADLSCGDADPVTLCWGDATPGLRWGDSEPADLRGEVVGVWGFGEAELDDARPTELCFGDPYGLAFGVEDDDETVAFLVPLPGLVVLFELCMLPVEPLGGDDTDEEVLGIDLVTWGFLGLCWIGILRVLLGGGISRGSLDDFEDRWGRVPGAGGRALDGRARRKGVLVSLLDPEPEAKALFIN